MRRTGREDSRHLLVGAGLGSDLQAEAQSVAIHEDLPVIQIGAIG